MCMDHEDKYFPAFTTKMDEMASGQRTLGDAYWRRLEDQNKKKEQEKREMIVTIDWCRASKLYDHMFANVYGDHISHLDVCQGGVLGTCWLLSAMACIADAAPNLIRACFWKAGGQGEKRSMPLSSDGRYDVTLFDCQEQKYVQVVIDDRVPGKYIDNPSSKAGQHSIPFEPLCAKIPQSGSIWPLLLEKAFAKFCGSYSCIDNKYGVWALSAIAGRMDTLAQAYSKVEDKDEWNVWRPATVLHKVNTSPQTKHVPILTKKTDVLPYTTAGILELFVDKLRLGSKNKSVGMRHIVVVITPSERLTNEGPCLKFAHAYSLLEVQRVEMLQPGSITSTVTLIKMRNPHGTENDWVGDWSDSSNLWSDHPGVAEAVSYERGNSVKTGEFWISHTDFGKLFNHLHVLRMNADDELAHSARGMYPGELASWACDFWQRRFSNGQPMQPWVHFKKACDVEVGRTQMVMLDAQVKQKAKHHNAVQVAYRHASICIELSLPSEHTFLEKVVKESLLCPVDDWKAWPVSTTSFCNMLQARIPGSEIVRDMTSCFKHLVEVFDYTELFSAMHQKEVEELRDAFPSQLDREQADRISEQCPDSRKWLMQRFGGWLYGSTTPARPGPCQDASCTSSNSSPGSPVPGRGSSRLLVFLAGPGAGKTTFAATLAMREEHDVQAVVFLKEHASLVEVVHSIALQLAAHLPALHRHIVQVVKKKRHMVVHEQRHIDWQQLLRLLLWCVGDEQIQQDLAGKEVVVVLDGLDQLEGDIGSQLIALLTQGLLKLKLVVTARPLPDITDALNKHCQETQSDADIISAEDAHHREDVMEFVRCKLEDRGVSMGAMLQQALPALVDHNWCLFRYKGYAGLNSTKAGVRLPDAKFFSKPFGESCMQQYSAGDQARRTKHTRNDFHILPQAVLKELLQMLQLTSGPSTQRQAATSGSTCPPPAPRRDSATKVVPFVLLHGMFGMGKTLLTHEVHQQAKAVGREVVWVHCGQLVKGSDRGEDKLRTTLEAEIAKVSSKEVFEQQGPGMDFQQLIRRHPQMLFIINGLWEVFEPVLQLIKAAVSLQGSGVQVLISSRNKLAQPVSGYPQFHAIHLGTAAYTHSVDGDRSIAEKVLLQMALEKVAQDHRVTATAHYTSMCEQVNGWPYLVNRILQQCDGCMLAVAMLGSRLLERCTAKSAADLLEEWKDQEKTFKQHLAEIFPPVSGVCSDCQRMTIYDAAKMSIDAVQPTNSGRDKQLACLHAVAAFPSGSPVQPCRSLVVWRDLMDAADIAALDMAAAAAADHKNTLRDLADRSLLFQEGQCYRIHDIVARYVLKHVTPSPLCETLCCAARGLGGAAVIALLGRTSLKRKVRDQLCMPERMPEEHISYLDAVIGGYANLQQLLEPCEAHVQVKKCVLDLLAAVVQRKAAAVWSAAEELVVVCTPCQNVQRPCSTVQWLNQSNTCHVPNLKAIKWRASAAGSSAHPSQQIVKGMANPHLAPHVLTAAARVMQRIDPSGGWDCPVLQGASTWTAAVDTAGRLCRVALQALHALTMLWWPLGPSKVCASSLAYLCLVVVLLAVCIQHSDDWLLE